MVDRSPYHVPVMVDEVVELLRESPPGPIVDATFGGGGHTRALLAARPDDPIVALDRDPDAAAQAQ
ncbi:MAG TPA: 16S rRNA (cytosine(1402)-N(4))-methyltransferase, partial [Acidimicrobiia bacterium]|nr:16S rRNA (cytosine(1402)-N(4))-methyltransferase [Acidimicrobiia bacterium]